MFYYRAPRAFRKDVGDNPDKLQMAENPALKEEFLQSLKNLKVKTWVEFFKEAKEIYLMSKFTSVALQENMGS